MKISLKKIAPYLPKKLQNILYWQSKDFLDYVKGENDSDPYTNGEYRFLLNIIKNCQLVFDVGANVGNWTKQVLQLNKNLIIHCFEPSESTYKLLIRNNFPPNVICNKLALSSVIAEKNFYIFEPGSGINSFYNRRGLASYGNKPPKSSETVQTETLDNYCQKHNISHIDLLKVDVEGHELEVFKGGRSLFERRQVDVIQFEYGGCNIDSRVLLMDIFDFLDDFEYSFYKIHSNHIEQVKNYDQKYENFAYQNWLIIKKDGLKTTS